MLKTLLDGRLLVKLLGKRFIREMKLWPAIQRDNHIRVNFANNSITILNKYIIIPINIEEVEAVIKTWLVDIEIYNLLFTIT